MAQKNRLFGLLGKSLSHSFSSRFFNEKFSREKKSASYVNFEIAHIEHFATIIHDHPELCGLNVTIPYKRAIIPFLNSISKEASSAEAVNTIAFYRHPDGNLILKGFNTDIGGFMNSINPLLSSTDRRALILGSGGAASAVRIALDKLGIKSLIVSRSPREGVITYDDLTTELVREHTVVVNATPLGTYPDQEISPPFPYHFLTPRHICHDLVYNPPVTMFMKQCSRQGARVKNGYDMLVNQALLSWEIWQNTFEK